MITKEQAEVLAAFQREQMALIAEWGKEMVASIAKVRAALEENNKVRRPLKEVGSVISTIDAITKATGQHHALYQNGPDRRHLRRLMRPPAVLTAAAFTKKN